MLLATAMGLLLERVVRIAGIRANDTRLELNAPTLPPTHSGQQYRGWEEKWERSGLGVRVGVERSGRGGEDCAIGSEHRRNAT